MTIIIAAIFPDAVILAADSKRSAPNGATSQVQKIRAVGNRTVVAKGGFGDLADSVWEAIDALPEKVRCSPSALADHLEQIGAKTHKVCLAKAVAVGAGDYGLYIFVAGIDARDEAVLIIIDAGKGLRREYRSSGAAEVTGMGSIPDAMHVAHAAASAVSTSNSPLPAIEWAAEAVRMARAKDSATIGFPVDLAAVTVGGVQWVKLEDS